MKVADKTPEEWRSLIPELFRKGDCQPRVRTVGELKHQLALLPDDLPVHCGFAKEADLVVYNTTPGIQFGPNLQLREPEE